MAKNLNNFSSYFQLGESNNSFLNSIWLIIILIVVLVILIALIIIIIIKICKKKNNNNHNNKENNQRQTIETVDSDRPSQRYKSAYNKNKKKLEYKQRNSNE